MDVLVVCSFEMSTFDEHVTGFLGNLYIYTYLG